RGWEFRIVRGDNGFYILTDLPFSALNTEYHKTVPASHSTLTPEFLINHILDARADIQIACDHMAELITTESTSQIIQLRFESILWKRQRNLQQIELFQSTMLNHARAIAEAINSGERKFEEFLPVLEHASRIKEWLRKANPDETLISEYLKAATSDTWVDKLPTKGV